MQIGKGQVPLRLNFDPLNSAVRRTSASAQLGRALAAAGNSAVAKQQARQVTRAARESIQQKDRTDAYREIASKLGNVREALSVPANAKPDVTTLKKVGDSLNETLKVLESETAKGAGRQDDALVRDIQESVQSLFTQSTDGSLKSLGDVGFSRKDGAVELDAARLAQVQAERPDDLESFAGTFIGERVAPLVNAATQALSDSESRGDLEQGLARKAVAVQADISRLETRKQDLLYQQVRFESQQTALKSQDDTLRQTRKQLEEQEEKEFPPDLLDVESRRAELQPNLLAPTPEAGPRPGAPAPAAPAPLHTPGLSGLNGVAAQPPAPGLTSFGLA